MTNHRGIGGTEVVFEHFSGCDCHWNKSSLFYNLLTTFKKLS